MPRQKKCGKCRRIKKNCKCGRPMFDGKNKKDVLSKLEEAFAQGCTDEEACIYADISLSALYRYEEEHLEFRERKQLLKQKPILLARTEVVKGIEGDKEFALKFLERRKKSEFAPHSTSIVDDGKGILTEERKAEIAGALENWTKLKKRNGSK